VATSPVGMTSETSKTYFPLVITNKYEIEKEIGQGAYGYVCAAKSKLTGNPVAVKKITKVFDKDIFSKRALRELKLLKHFNGHPNVFLVHVDNLNT
jgi:mitogen-activated protein kinase 7